MVFLEHATFSDGHSKHWFSLEDLSTKQTKPDAPAEIRGKFGTINTNVTGIQLGDLLPMSAKMMDKWSIIRSLNHHDAGLSTGDQICITGYNTDRAPAVKIHPSICSIISKQLGHLNTKVPS